MDLDILAAMDTPPLGPSKHHAKRQVEALAMSLMGTWVDSRKLCGHCKHGIPHRRTRSIKILLWPLGVTTIVVTELIEYQYTFMNTSVWTRSIVEVIL